MREHRAAEKVAMSASRARSEDGRNLQDLRALQQSCLEALDATVLGASDAERMARTLEECTAAAEAQKQVSCGIVSPCPPPSMDCTEEDSKRPSCEAPPP